MAQAGWPLGGYGTASSLQLHLQSFEGQEMWVGLGTDCVAGCKAVTALLVAPGGGRLPPQAAAAAVRAA